MNTDDQNPHAHLLRQATESLRATTIPSGPPSDLVMRTAIAMQHHPRRMARFAAVASIAATLLLIIGGWLLSRLGGGELAFADVMQQVEKTTTLQATIINFDNGHSRQSSAKIMIKEPRGRIEGDDGTIVIEDDTTGDSLRLNTRTMVATHSIQRTVGDISLYAEFRQMANSTPKSLGPKTIGGRVLNGFAGTIELMGIKNVPATVWVDPHTKLPVRVEIQSAAGGPIVSVFDDIGFDVPLDDSLFSTTPPKGYRVDEEGGLTRSQLAALPHPTTSQLKQLVLRPGWGIGSLPLSSSTAQIAAVFGEPAGPAVPDVLSYPAMGVTFWMSHSGGGVEQIRAESTASSVSSIRDFPGRTLQQIRIGSSRKEIERAYGPPDRTDGIGDALQSLSYDKLGIDFELINDRVTKMVVSGPSAIQASPMLPTTSATTVPVVTKFIKPTVVVPLPAEPGPAPTQEELQHLVLKPGVGIGDVHFGATRPEVEALLGAPQGVMRAVDKEYLQYTGDGLMLSIDSHRGLDSVYVVEVPKAPKPPATRLQWRPFVGCTDRQIRIGSTLEQIEAAYGKTSKSPVSVKNHPEIHESMLIYEKLDLMLMLDAQDRCQSIDLWWQPKSATKP